MGSAHLRPRSAGFSAPNLQRRPVSPCSRNTVPKGLNQEQRHPSDLRSRFDSVSLQPHSLTTQAGAGVLSPQRQVSG